MEGFIQRVGNTTPSRRSVSTALVIAMLLMTLGPVMADEGHAQETNSDEFVNGEIVVKLNGASNTTLADIYRENPEVDPARTETFLESSGIYLLRLKGSSPTAADTQRVTDDLRNAKAPNDTPRLIYAEPNYTTDAPEDSRYMRSNGDSSPAPSSDSAPYQNQYAARNLNLTPAHSVNKGANTTVAVLDTGAQPDHPELAGSLVPGYDYIEDTGDQNGPTDEPNGADDDRDGRTDEATGHGTHVAGIVHLTAPDAQIMPLRVLDSDGRGNVFVIAEAVQRAVDPDGDPKTNDGVDVINMSLSSSRESDLIRDVSDDLDAVEEDDDDDDDTGPALQGVPVGGVTVVGSAGNDALEQPAYPAAETGVIGVASVDRQEKKSDFSNYFGSPEVDVSAPGDDIYSTFTEGRYAEWDGTSMAAPFVAGQAALIRSLRPGLPSTAPSGEPSVSEYITTTARSIDDANDNTAWKGKLGGHADACASVKALAPATSCSTAQSPSNTAPTLSAVQPTGAIRDRTPLLAATVRDAQTNLTKGNLMLYLNGRKIGISSYNTSTDRMYRTVRLSPGTHTVRVTARDAQGLSATRSWGFRIVR